MRIIILVCNFLLFNVFMITTLKAQGFGSLKKKNTITDVQKDTVNVKPVMPNSSSNILPNISLALTNAKPIKMVDTTTEGGFNSNNKRSQRDVDAFDSETISRKPMKDKPLMEYQKLREDDALFSEFVWEEIDAREKINRTFLYNSSHENEDSRFMAILLRAINDGVIPFHKDDDRFTTPLDQLEINEYLKGKLVTDTEEDLNGDNVPDTLVYYNKPEPDSIYTFRIKEQWIFDSKTSRMYCRIIGIAPIISKKVKGQVQGIKEPLFWLNYKQLRPYLAKSEVYNPKNLTNRITWEQLFESRYFNSYVVKSTMDNYNDKTLKELFQNNIKRLQEGDKIKQKIFDFEQDRWVY